MKEFRYIFLWLFIITTISGCDYVEQPYVNPPVDPGACPAPTFPQNTNTRKNILFEEFTGHTCGNCPGGAYDLRTIYAPEYQDTLILVSVHAGSFAWVELPDYPEDFSTPAGETFNTFFGVTGYPVGMVNRTSYAGNVLVGKANWANALAVEAAKPLEINLQMIIDYDSTANTACIHVETEFLTAKAGQFNLIVYVVEDSIVAAQKNYPGSGDPTYAAPMEANYMHRHVLRDNVNSTWGSSVINGNAAAGDKFVNSFQYSFNPSWNKEHLHIVAYIYEDASKEVQQAIEQKLLE